MTERLQEEEEKSILEKRLKEARETVLNISKLLKCQSCNGNLVYAEQQQPKPWRSRNCEHIFCANCASIIRGDHVLIGSKHGDSICPVKGCGIPVRPVDIVEDFVTGQIVEACGQLVVWASVDDVGKEEKENVVMNGRRLFDNSNDDDDDDDVCIE